MVDLGTVVFWTEEMDTIQVGYVHSPVEKIDQYVVGTHSHKHHHNNIWHNYFTICIKQKVPTPVTIWNGNNDYNANLVLGARQSEPYSCTCMPKKHTSTPSISSNTNMAFVLYGNCGGKSPENLSRMSGRVSRVLSEEDTTRIVTRPAPVLSRKRILFTRSSRYEPSLVVGRPGWACIGKRCDISNTSRNLI